MALGSISTDMPAKLSHLEEAILSIVLCNSGARARFRLPHSSHCLTALGTLVAEGFITCEVEGTTALYTITDDGIAHALSKRA